MKLVLGAGLVIGGLVIGIRMYRDTSLAMQSHNRPLEPWEQAIANMEREQNIRRHRRT